MKTHFVVNGKPACKRIRQMQTTTHYKRTDRVTGVDCGACRRSRPYKEAVNEQ